MSYSMLCYSVSLKWNEKIYLRFFRSIICLVVLYLQLKNIITVGNAFVVKENK